MTPTESQVLLREHGFYAKWEGRRLIGGSTYLPGNPGKFEGILFTLTLLSAGVWEGEVTGFEGEVTRIEQGSYEGRKDLEALTTSVIRALQNKLHRSGGSEVSYCEAGPPLWLGVQLGQAAPNATSDIEALSRIFVTEEQQAELESSAKLSGLRVTAPSEDSTLSEEMLLALPLGPVPTAPEWRPIISQRNGLSANRFRLTRDNVDSAIEEAGPNRTEPPGTPNLVSYYGAHSESLDFTWAPLVEIAGWPDRLRIVHHPLSVPREMSTVVLISALCQIAEQMPAWLDLIMFTTEPVDGKVTACFYGSKADPPKREKPEWLTALVDQIKPRYATSVSYDQLDDTRPESCAWRDFWQKKP
jgi:hypothetical protein